MIDNRCHRVLIAIVSVGGENKDFFAEAGEAANNGLNFAGLAGEHGADDETE